MKEANSLDAGDANQSQFLEALLVWQADGELKNSSQYDLYKKVTLDSR